MSDSPQKDQKAEKEVIDITPHDIDLLNDADEDESDTLPYEGDDEEPNLEADTTLDAKVKDAYLPVKSGGSLESFIREINRYPMLEEEDEKALARRLRDYGDLDAARKLVMSHLRLVVSIARAYLGYGLPLSDLIQEGNIGLMKAVRHFDPEVGVRLAAFAVHWIKAEIHEYVIKNWRIVKVATTKKQRTLFFNLRHNKKHLGWLNEQEKTDLADNLGVNVNDVSEMESRLSGQDIGFDLESDDSTSSPSVAPAAYLEDENSDFALNYEQNDYRSYELKRLREALSEIDERSRYIIKRRWLDEDKATLQELSKELNVSLERVRQIESTALKKVKQLLLTEDSSGLMALEYKDAQKLKERESKLKDLKDHKEVEATLIPAPKKRGRKKKEES